MSQSYPDIQIAMSSYFPRVLIISGSSFGDHSATSVTLTNLFRDWPTERLALVYSDCRFTNPDSGTCIRSWELPLSNVPVDRTVRKLLGVCKKHLLRPSSKDSLCDPSGPGDTQTNSWHQWFHGFARSWADLLPICPPCDFWAWVTDFQPEVIYTMMGSIRLLRLTNGVADRFDVPIVPHFMDDWPTTQYLGWVSWVPRRILLRFMRSVLERSPFGMSIGPSMSAEYEQRYKLNFLPFMNCVDVPAKYEPMPTQDSLNPVNFLFFGGLHLHRWRLLESVGLALAKLKEQGYVGELNIYTSETEIARYGTKFSTIPQINVNEMPSFDYLRTAIQDADVLVHVDSFDEATRRYLRFSLSTKLPLCMAAGKPLLLYGPNEISSTRYVRESQCGLVVGEEDPELLLETIRILICDPRRRAALGQQGWTIAQTNHSATSVRECFRAALADARLASKG